MSQRRFQNPKGTRDFYPLDMLRRRYVTEAWRAVSLRHGFEEIDGPTFEHLDLYTVKSGEEIVSQLFSFTRAGGDDTYALRPEFTPTLARMYAARAAQLPKPVRWFSVLSYFRAERPQRGRLREFLQWNCDVIGDSQMERDEVKYWPSNREILDVSIDSLLLFGFRSRDAVARLNTAGGTQRLLDVHGMTEASIRQQAIQHIDVFGKVPQQQWIDRAMEIGFAPEFVQLLLGPTGDVDLRAVETISPEYRALRGFDTYLEIQREVLSADISMRAGLTDRWFQYAPTIVRGLAYYTGLVFEITAEGERAVAGGGRYDNLIELLGGPPTPAVGFAMGDVVLSNLLDDKGLMPSEEELPGAVESMLRAQRVRPEVFVVSGGEEDDQHVIPLVARLRRGIERDNWASDARPWDTDRRYAVRPLHARTTDKATRNLKKLLADAQRQGARFAAVIHGADKVQLKDLDAREDLPDNFSIEPDSPTYVGRAVTQRLDR